MDASEGTVQNEQLAVRFKTADTTKEFKAAVDKAKEHIEKKEKSEEEVSSSTGKLFTPLICKWYQPGMNWTLVKLD